jgi:hypothetical protein
MWISWAAILECIFQAIQPGLHKSIKEKREEREEMGRGRKGVRKSTLIQSYLPHVSAPLNVSSSHGHPFSRAYFKQFKLPL